MSIYSGLPTRQDQRNYNNLLVKLLTTLQEHVIYSTQGIIQNKFANKYHKIIAKMQNYQEHKYLPPKFSTLLTPLIKSIHNSRGQTFSQSFNKTSDKISNHPILQSVKQQEQLPSARQINSKKKNQKSILRKIHYESQNDKNQKRMPLQTKNELTKNRYSSSGNRRSCSVFSYNKKKVISNGDAKQDDKSQSILPNDLKIDNQTKKSHSFFKNKKIPLTNIHQKKRKVYLSHIDPDQNQAKQQQINHKRHMKTQGSRGTISHPINRKLPTHL